MLRNTASTGASSRAAGAFKPRRRPGTHAILPSRPATVTACGTTPSSISSANRSFSSRSGASGSMEHSVLSRHVGVPHRIKVEPSPCIRFSTSAMSKKKKTPSSSGSTSASKPNTAARVEGEVIYRKEGSKIVPVAAADQVDSPVSGLFSQFEEFTVKPSSSTAPPPEPVKGSTQEVDLASLTLEDVFPPDEFVQQLIKQKKLSMTLEESKDLVQGLLNVLPLPEKDSKRVQAEKEFIAACKKKSVNMGELAQWSLQYTRDGSPLAFAIFKIASDNGDIISRYSYGTMLYRGAKGVPRDVALGRSIIQSLATPSKSRAGFRGLPWAMVTLGGIYARDDQNFEAARDWYQMAGEQGIVEARIALGRMYLSGELPRDVALAKKYFQSAISTGSESGTGDDYAEAHFMLGALEMNENPTPNHKLAFQHYQRAASKGLAEAQYNVGQAYFRGLGVPKNDALAVEYWKMSGQQGFGLAQLSLGAYYFQDETPAEPSSESTKDGQKTGVAADEDKPNLAKHVWDPSKKDLQQAQKWFTLASRRPGQLGLEGQRLKEQVDEAIRRGGGASKNGRMCTIM
ncbi:hypothetical protein BG006_009432 [Podila minutissima]|uniref:Uncharacterized protein n=1 Tax=Podila minutissima TaxID=64525 RepID=A0A9P5VJA3_9FUNG|nr:hypothetical protein BG006_009432 [Podila minutissima]